MNWDAFFGFMIGVTVLGGLIWLTEYVTCLIDDAFGDGWASVFKLSLLVLVGSMLFGLFYK